MKNFIIKRFIQGGLCIFFLIAFLQIGLVRSSIVKATEYTGEVCRHLTGQSSVSIENFTSSYDEYNGIRFYASHQDSSNPDMISICTSIENTTNKDQTITKWSSDFCPDRGLTPYCDLANVAGGSSVWGCHDNRVQETVNVPLPAGATKSYCRDIPKEQECGLVQWDPVVTGVFPPEDFPTEFYPNHCPNSSCFYGYLYYIGSTECPVFPTCGDGLCNEGETCDGSSKCISTGSLVGLNECRAPGSSLECTYCGDGIVQSEEECDDGNMINDDLCDNNCTVIVPPKCGDGKIDPGEECDDGNTNDNDGCSNSCVIPSGPYCGDGVIHPGEECDDGNNINGDGCSTSCRIETIELCGDGRINTGEECDPTILNSCGGGAQCHPVDCICQPVLPGLCGSLCADDSGCPSDHTCYDGTCRLSICLSGFAPIISSPVSGVNVSTRVVCTNNDCDVVLCGGSCGKNEECPAGMTCNGNNICILTFCANNVCQDQCVLPDAPSSALIGEKIDTITLSLLLVILGVLVYRLDLVQLSWDKFLANGGDRFFAFFDDHTRIKVHKKNMKKSRDGFEEKFKKKNKK